MQGEPGPDLVVLVGRLERRDEVDPPPGHGIDPGLDRAVGEDHRGGVVLEHGGERPDRRLVARHHSDQPGDAVRRQVHVGDVVDELATDQREPHLRRAVELAVGHPEREGRRDQPDRQIVRGDAAGHAAWTASTFSGTPR